MLSEMEGGGSGMSNAAKITICQSELYPFWIVSKDTSEGVECEISDETLGRWEKAMEVFAEVQEEMGDVIEKELTKRRRRGELI